TYYCVPDRPIDSGAFDSPTFTGLAVGQVEKVDKRTLVAVTDTPLANGDGLNVLIKREVVGFRANVVELLDSFEEDGQPRLRYRIEPNALPAALSRLRPLHPLNRNLDHNWQQALLKPSAERRVAVHWQLLVQADHLELQVSSEEGITASARLSGAVVA